MLAVLYYSVCYASRSVLVYVMLAVLYYSVCYASCYIHYIQC